MIDHVYLFIIAFISDDKSRLFAYDYSYFFW